jgi:hypothetical protein
LQSSLRASAFKKPANNNRFNVRMIAFAQLPPFRESALNTPNAHPDFNTLINAPKFSDDPIGHRQKKRWQLIAGDIYKSTSKEALLEARGRAEGYIHGLVDAGHLSTRDPERDYLILSIVQRRREFLQKLLNEYRY